MLRTVLLQESSTFAGNVGDLELVDDFVYPYRLFPDLHRPEVLKDASLDATDKNFTRTEWRMSDIAVLPVAGYYLNLIMIDGKS